MNNRISEAFAKGKAFIPFITCGDPSLEITEQLVYAMEEAGADLIELGIPFSDPTAEGPVIQEANVRALSGGVTTDKIFDMVVKIRKKTNIPMVFIDRDSKDKNISGVLVDDKLGATMAVDHLIKLGHKRIGYIHGNETGDDKHRFQGYKEMMEKNNLPIDEDIILRGYYEEALAYSEMRSMLSSGIKLPDAMFCANDEMAWGCIQALQDVGIKVPEDVSVIGYDDSTLSAYYGVPLTTVHSPIVEMGSASANELFRLLNSEGDKSGTVTKLSPTMVYRSSCGKHKERK